MKHTPKRNKYALILIAITMIAILSACANPNPMTGTAFEETGKIAGFGTGLWDGMTAVIAFLLSLFGGNYGIYEVHNTGNWYNFGFLLGVGGIAKFLSSLKS